MQISPRNGVSSRLPLLVLHRPLSSMRPLLGARHSVTLWPRHRVVQLCKLLGVLNRLMTPVFPVLTPPTVLGSLLVVRIVGRRSSVVFRARASRRWRWGTVALP